MKADGRAGNGGKREGAGNKPGSKRDVLIVNKVKELWEENADQLAQACLDLALGVKMLREDSETVYKTKPDGPMLMYISNHIVGKPVERIELDAQLQFLVKVDL